MSELTLQSVVESSNKTEGLKSTQGSLPVLPPTQLPQPSIKASPLKSPLQSEDPISKINS
jgi:hypothetical protein